MIPLILFLGSLDLAIVLLLCSHRARRVVRRLISPRLNSSHKWQRPVNAPVRQLDIDMIAYLSAYHTGCRFTAEHVAGIYFK